MEATAAETAVAEQAEATTAGKTPSRCAIAFCFDALMVRSGALLDGAPDPIINPDQVINFDRVAVGNAFTRGGRMHG